MGGEDGFVLFSEPAVSEAFATCDSEFGRAEISQVLNVNRDKPFNSTLRPRTWTSPKNGEQVQWTVAAISEATT